MYMPLAWRSTRAPSQGLLRHFIHQAPMIRLRLAARLSLNVLVHLQAASLMAKDFKRVFFHRYCGRSCTTVRRVALRVALHTPDIEAPALPRNTHSPEGLLLGKPPSASCQRPTPEDMRPKLKRALYRKEESNGRRGPTTRCRRVFRPDQVVQDEAHQEKILLIT